LDALVHQLKKAAHGFEPSFTVSIGAVLAEDDDNVETVLRRADQAMYAAKRERP
jgi:GGDEF domain-containing protein